jgi:hypothetical protein
MAKYRMVNTKFWSDTFIRESLNPLDRYLFLYFLTNEKTNIAGIYELPISIISSETGLERIMLTKMMRRLKDKVCYYKGWVILKNFIKYQNLGSDEVKKGIENALKEIPIEIRQKIDSLRWSIDGLPTIPISSGESEPQSEPQSELESKSKILATPSVAKRKDQEIFNLIELFKPINPSYKRFYANTTQRACLDRLIKENGQEQIEWILNVLPKTNTMQYSPVITTPQQLENKIGQLKAFVLKEKSKLENKLPIIAKI